MLFIGAGRCLCFIWQAELTRSGRGHYQLAVRLNKDVLTRFGANKLCTKRIMTRLSEVLSCRGRSRFEVCGPKIPMTCNHRARFHGQTAYPVNRTTTQHAATAC